jgi:hypothetical protein
MTRGDHIPFSDLSEKPRERPGSRKGSQCDFEVMIRFQYINLRPRETLS